MKEFRKTKENFFVCEECGLLAKLKKNLIRHINLNHDKEQYFNKWLFEYGDNHCKICNKETIHQNRFFDGYKNCCSKECSKKYNQQQTEIGCLKKYGVKNVYQSKLIKQKNKQICFEKYGDENFRNLEKSKQTCFKNNGCEWSLQNKDIREKGKQTCLKKYGVEWSLQNKDIREKGKQTCLKKYGVESSNSSIIVKQNKIQSCLKKYNVENPMQNKEIYEKQQISGFNAKKYKDTNIFYRGSYELDFLEKFYDKYPDIVNGKAINYNFNKKNKIYFPDFYIPSLNLIIEIKSKYYYNKFKALCIVKKRYTKKQGYNYLLIIDKKYSYL